MLTKLGTQSRVLYFNGRPLTPILVTSSPCRTRRATCHTLFDPRADADGETLKWKRLNSL